MSVSGALLVQCVRSTVIPFCIHARHCDDHVLCASAAGVTLSAQSQTRRRFSSHAFFYCLNFSFTNRSGAVVHFLNNIIHLYIIPVSPSDKLLICINFIPYRLFSHVTDEVYTLTSHRIFSSTICWAKVRRKDI